MDFPWNKPSSELGVPPFREPPHIILQHRCPKDTLVALREVSPSGTICGLISEVTVVENKRRLHHQAADRTKWGYAYSWVVCFTEYPNIKWMITGGTPMTMETSICSKRFPPPLRKWLRVGCPSRSSRRNLCSLAWRWRVEGLGVTNPRWGSLYVCCFIHPWTSSYIINPL